MKLLIGIDIFSIKATSAIVLLLLASKAFAQFDIPPTYPTVELLRSQQSAIDSNGVDVISSALTAEIGLVSVGDPKFGGLSFKLIYRNAQWSHNFAFTVSDIMRSPFDIPTMLPFGLGSDRRNLPNFKTMVTTAGAAEKFLPSATAGENLPYSNANGTGGVLSTGNTSAITSEHINLIGNSNFNSVLSASGNYSYTSRDGSIYTFSTMGGYNDNFMSGRQSAHPVSLFYAPSQSAQAIVTKIIRPNGEIIKFYYDLSVSPKSSDSSYLSSYVRLRAISNNFGYKIKLYYSNSGAPVADWRGVPPRDWVYPTSVQAINQKFGHCENFSNSCTGPQVVATSSLVTTPSAGCREQETAGNLPFVTVASISVTDPNLKMTKFEMDCHSNLTAIILPSGQKATATYIRTKYDSVDVSVAGNRIYKPILYSLSNLTVRGLTYVYSQVGDPLCGLFLGWNTSCPSGVYSVTRTNPDGSSVSFGSDRANSFLLSKTNELNQTISYREDSFGRLIEQQFPEQNVISFDYDSRGNVIKRTRVETQSQPECHGGSEAYG